MLYTIFCNNTELRKACRYLAICVAARLSKYKMLRRFISTKFLDFAVSHSLKKAFPSFFFLKGSVHVFNVFSNALYTSWLCVYQVVCAQILLTYGLPYFCIHYNYSFLSARLKNLFGRGVGAQMYLIHSVSFPVSIWQKRLTLKCKTYDFRWALLSICRNKLVLTFFLSLFFFFS